MPYTGTSSAQRDWLMPFSLVAQAVLAALLCSGSPVALGAIAAALGLGLWGRWLSKGPSAVVAMAASFVAMVGVVAHWSGLRELALANAMVVLSLLPALGSPVLVLCCGAVMLAFPFSAAMLGLGPDLPPMNSSAYILVVMLCLQTLALGWIARSTNRSMRERFDMEFLVRAMGTDGAIRLNFDVVRAETGIGRRLKHVQDRMATALRQARTAVDGMREDSRVLQDDSEKLRERTERSAAGLRDAAMTLEQITTIVQASANAAMEARSMADNASTQAQAGAETFAQVTQRMHDIEQASRKITDIVGVIDGIAFQTNILALNAAVEAARAGEQGRGFAVVAAEVRSLALRAAQAAGEVKVLINTSMVTVRDGTELVRVADGRIKDLVTSVTQVGEVFANLSADTSEHAGSIDAVTRAVMELDELTRQNVSMAESTQGIAANLLAQGTQLEQVLGAFKLGGAGDEPAARPVTPPRRVAERAATASLPPPPTAPAKPSPQSGNGDGNVEFF